MIYSTKYSINTHCCCKKTGTKFSGCQLYSGLPPIICQYTTPYLISYSKGLLDASSLFGQSYKWCTHVHMKQQSQNRDLHSQYEYSHETFSSKDDLRGGEYLINRIYFKRRNAPLTRICDRSLVFAPAKTGIFEGAKHSNIRQF